MSSPKNILYISYDGMTDPLGQSQVLPYIIGLAKEGYHFTLLSAEKPERYLKYRELIQEICTQNNINWVTVPFTTFPPFVSKMWDVQNLKRRAIQLHKQYNFDLVHCRSYISAEIGRLLKKKYGVKYLFDMRGFWVDERVEGGMWNLSNPFYRFWYKHYKKKEEQYIADADQIISLTEAGKIEIQSWPSYNANPIEVIPCSADFDLFAYVTDSEKLVSKMEIGYKADDFVVSYLGSVGTWYLLDEMLDFFCCLKTKYYNVRFLFVTPDNPEVIYSKAALKQIDKKVIKVVFASRKEVRKYMSCSDISLSFIKQSYSKTASSPTKLGELLAMGIPVVCNSGVGDVKAIIEHTGGGYLINEFAKNDYEGVMAKMDNLRLVDRLMIRKKAYEYYNLHEAIKKYSACYFKLLSA